VTNICLDLKSKVPIYIQVRDQLRLMIVTGELPEGAQMPPVRDLAQELLINPNTVSKAYQELERDGYIFTQRGMGTYISKRDLRPQAEVGQEAHASKIAEELVTRMMEFGMKPDQIRELVDRILSGKSV
jgi:GntR family transcriptional regulator